MPTKQVTESQEIGAYSESCNETPRVQEEGKESILIIGDSISQNYGNAIAPGYTEFVRPLLQDYEVIHNICNAMTSRNGLVRIDHWLAARDHYKLITFNHGIWDIAYKTSIADYQYNIWIEGIKIKQVSDHAIFFTTSHIPPNTAIGSPAWVTVGGEEAAYNAAAIEVMQGLGIEVVDLNALMITIPSSGRVTPTDVHFTIPTYRDIVAPFVANAILDSINQ